MEKTEMWKKTSMLVLVLVIIEGLEAYSIAKKGCLDKCGKISVPYPFGIGLHCALNPSFNLSCDPPNNTLYSNFLNWESTMLGYLTLEPVQILDVDLDLLTTPPCPTLAISSSYNKLGYPSNDSNGGSTLLATNTLDMRGSPYTLMPTRNILLAKGCGGSVVLKDASDNIVTGCSTVCHGTSGPHIMGFTGCYGISCCQTFVAASADYFMMEFLTIPLMGNPNVSDFIEAAVFDAFSIDNRSLDRIFSDPLNIPSVLRWTVPFSDSQIRSDEYSNSVFQGSNNRTNPTLGMGYTGQCRYEKYEGNPYLPNGCQVIKECQNCPFSCARITRNNSTTTANSSTTIGNNSSWGCPLILKPKKNSATPIIVLGLGIGIGSLLGSILLYVLFGWVKKRKEMRRKLNNFKRNGGFLLQQQTSASEGSIERSKVFTCSELERATDNFSENRILGRGGQGTVYKGMLTDGSIVAIKKSKKVDESQLGQFINEVVILSQINHRNIVKLFGCCLETEVPLLVYEFVQNGTLFEHIHNLSANFFTWKKRLQIATESAEALAYLHSASYAPVYHRDIKTSNILLDDKYRAKIADFGTSKTIAIDQTHVTTCVQGTFGYIDPEFFQSNQFTDKSDVYSFGVVLVELLTSKKAVNTDRHLDTRSLAYDFIDHMNHSRLYDIIDAGVLAETPKDDLDCVANLARKCLSVEGLPRPAMKEVATTLHMLASRNLAPIPLPMKIVEGEEDITLNQMKSLEVDGDYSVSTSSTYASNSDQDPSYIHEQPLLSDASWYDTFA